MKHQLILFTNNTCMPCAAYKPIVDQVMDLYQDEISLTVVKKSESPLLFVKHGVGITPSICYRDYLMIGSATKQELIDFIKKINNRIDNHGRDGR